MHFFFNDIAYTLGFGQSRHITVSGSVASGNVLVVQGYSGSGKTTLLRILARLQHCNGGEVYLEGKNWLHIPGTAWRADVHYLAQKPALFDGTVAGNLFKPFETKLLCKKGPDHDKARAYMKKLLLEEGLWNQDARTLSGGEAARLAFVRALLIQPKVMLLDEPTAGMNPSESRDLTNFIRRLRDEIGLTILLIEHDMHVVMNVSNQITVLDFGKKIAEGDAWAIRSNPQVIEAYLGRGAATGSNYGMREAPAATGS